MYTKKCYRSLDKPIMFLGLELEDLCIITFISGLLAFLISPMISVIFAITSGFSLKKIKDGKPAGYMFYLLYKTGIINILPGTFRYPHLVKPPFLRKIKLIHFSCREGEIDKKSAYERFFWFERERIDEE